mgnify:CR=1 FL=1
MELIRAESVTYQYGGTNKKALNGVSFAVNEGEFVAILGHNGSGKSTLARLISAINIPTDGTLTVAGCDVADESDENVMNIRRQVGMVFQNPDNQLVTTVVEEDVAFALENLGIEYNEMHRRVDDALAAVGMTEYKKHATHRLSGGQKQRVAIAGMLAMNPRILVLDEPTAMLDPGGRREVMNILRQLHRNGVTVILITHFMNEAAEADRILVLNGGEILLEGTPEYVFQNAGLLQSIGLSVPQSTELMFALRADGYRVPLAVLTEDGCADVLAAILDGKIGRENV